MCSFSLISTDPGPVRADLVTDEVGRVTRLLMVLGLGLAGVQWIGARLRRLRHQSVRKVDALLTSNEALIRPIPLVLGLTVVERIRSRFRRTTAPPPRNRTPHAASRLLQDSSNSTGDM